MFSAHDIIFNRRQYIAPHICTHFTFEDIFKLFSKIVRTYIFQKRDNFFVSLLLFIRCRPLWLAKTGECALFTRVNNILDRKFKHWFNQHVLLVRVLVIVRVLFLLLLFLLLLFLVRVLFLFLDRVLVVGRQVRVRIELCIKFFSCFFLFFLFLIFESFHLLCGIFLGSFYILSTLNDFRIYIRFDVNCDCFTIAVITKIFRFA